MLSLVSVSNFQDSGKTNKDISRTFPYIFVSFGSFAALNSGMATGGGCLVLKRNSREYPKECELLYVSRRLNHF